ncbi:cell surface protein, partial [Acinetobacter sp. SCC477]|nr:cell surface protein [Acinetobacter pollinis]
SDGNLIVGLAKDATFTSVTTGNTTINNDGLTILNGPSVTSSGIDAGSKTITNVADGVNSTDAVNKGQLDTATTNLTNAGLNFAANSGSTIHKNLGETLTIKGTGTKDDSEYDSSNIKTTTDSDGNLIVGLAKDATFTSVTTGNTTINNDGLTILNGPSVTSSGIDAGSKTITNVADAVNGTDAVNKNQLDDATSSLTSTGLNFAANSGSTIHKNLGETLTIKGTGTKDDSEYDSSNIKTTTDSDGNLIVGLAKDATFTSVTTGNTTLNSNGLTIVNGPSITSSGVDAGSKTITNVADAVNGTDAVNKNQLDDATSGLTSTGLNFAANSGSTIHKNLGETLTIKGTGTKDDSEYDSSNIKTTTDSDGNLIVGLAKDATFTSVTTGNTTINNDGLTILNGPS